MMAGNEEDDCSLAEAMQTSDKAKVPTEDKHEAYRDMTKTPPPISTGKSKRNAKRGKIGKKPADMPRRPLSGYNYFFSDQRSQILEEQAKVKDEKRDIFTTLGRIVADRWKKLGEKDKEKYNDLASKDLIRYRKEMEKYNEKIAMRNRKESEVEIAKGSATASMTKSDQLQASTSSEGEMRPNPLMRGIPQATFNAEASFGQYPGAMSAPGYPGYAGTGLGYHSGRAVYPQVAQSMDLGRMTLTQHENLAGRMDPMLGGVDLPALLGQLPPPPDGRPRVNVLYPQGVSPLGFGPQASLRLPYQGSLSAGGLLASREADAAFLQSLGGGGTDTSVLRGLGSPLHPSSAAAGAPSDALLGRIRQQRKDESIRQVYAQMLQRRQAEDEEAIRQLRQRHWPAGSGGDGRYPY
mmetsp:Transcript_16224/g.30897  ORF Transcript_16224/g.30897 Transcript_16224/m.30897 type:complete len:408 (+) Transcript_16224:116-1339(+)